jgi:AraC-like DNA-binding protein
MTVEPRDSDSVRFSTGALHPSKRLTALREHFAQTIRLDIDAVPGQAVEMTTDTAPGLRRTKMLTALSARLSRRSNMLVDGVDAVCLMIKTGGHLALSQCGREAQPQVGDGVLLLYREPALMHFVDTTYVAVRVPCNALASVAGNLESAAARRIPGDSEALSLLRTYLANLPAQIADPQLRQLSAAHIYDLITVAIGATEEGRHIAKQRGVRAARLAAIKSDLLSDCTLDIHQVALRRGVSPRYIQMLFAGEGTTFSMVSVEFRLDAARKMLKSPRYSAWSVSAIALEAGFGDLSHFNRRFKQRFAVTPSELRASAHGTP